MCNFFSFLTDEFGKKYYFNWEQRQKLIKQGCSGNSDSHSYISRFSGVSEDKCNKYEYNPLTKKFYVDQINSKVDDRIRAEEWVSRLDFKLVVEPLIIKPIINPFLLPKAILTDKDIELLFLWDSVGDSVRGLYQ